MMSRSPGPPSSSAGGYAGALASAPGSFQPRSGPAPAPARGGDGGDPALQARDLRAQVQQIAPAHHLLLPPLALKVGELALQMPPALEVVERLLPVETQRPLATRTACPDLLREARDHLRSRRRCRGG